ncbi:MAG: crotonobetainyl-CoA:carnitine CoA-transferase CaiB-like acyl-CoA transferase [Cryomorphaceae bacterium]|jgi:crotonobetainyl-CoA:carnitine CoA-transferase CaiB-like acyl-CoA transferase
MSGPLDGVVVVELTSVVLGPYACQMLGDLGADVIKIEPLSGDTNRNLGPYSVTDNMRSLYLGCNRNKRSVSLDLKSPDGKAAALEIIRGADVVIHNFRPSAMQRLGLDYHEVRELNPEVVYCAAYGYSKKGPYGDKGALDDSIQAASGIAILQSMVGGDPSYLPTVIADKTTAQNVVQAVLAALFHKERTGQGQEIEVPMFETMVSFVMTEHLMGQSFEPSLGEAGYPRLLAQHRRPYKTKDNKFIALLPYWDNHWRSFCELSGHAELITDPRFINMSERLKHINESYRLTGEIVAQKTRDEWLELLGQSNVPMMEVNTLDELIDDPQLIASGFWNVMDHPTEGQLRMTSPPINFSETPASIRRVPPLLGQHSEEILLEAGLSQSQIDDMLASGIAKSAD